MRANNGHFNTTAASRGAIGTIGTFSFIRGRGRGTIPRVDSIFDPNGLLVIQVIAAVIRRFFGLQIQRKRMKEVLACVLEIGNFEGDRELEVIADWNDKIAITVISRDSEVLMAKSTNNKRLTSNNLAHIIAFPSEAGSGTYLPRPR